MLRVRLFYTGQIPEDFLVELAAKGAFGNYFPKLVLS
jgi:hypothetical protein